MAHTRKRSTDYSQDRSDGEKFDVDFLQANLFHSDPVVQLRATKRIRKLLSNDRESVVNSVLDKKVHENLIQILALVDFDESKNGLTPDQPSAQLQIEALWALTNVAAGTSTHVALLVEAGVVPVLVNLLSSRVGDVLEQAIWVLGNVAGDGSAARDKVLRARVLDPLLVIAKGAAALTPNSNGFGTTASNASSTVAKKKKRVVVETDEGEQEVKTNNLTLLRVCTWTLSNLCDHQPRPDVLADDDSVDDILLCLRDVLQKDDTEVLNHACWALSHICDGPSPHVGAVVDCPDLASRLVELLTHKSWRVVKPALRTVGNIVCAEDDQDYTQVVIDYGAVSNLEALVRHTNREIQKEACWTLSNIAAGTVGQIQRVLDSGAIPKLVHLAGKPDFGSGDPASSHASSFAADNFAKLSSRKKNQRKKKNQRVNKKTTRHHHSPSSSSTLSTSSGETSTQPDPDVRIEACWVLLNATSCGSEDQIERMIHEGCVDVLCGLLEDSSMAAMALEGLEKILAVGEAVARKDPDAVNLKTTDEQAKAQEKRRMQLENGALCDVLKIEELRTTHRLGEIRKRTSAMWSSHFVTCGICSRSYSRHGDSTFYCEECKCVVCGGCDCSRFHLSYQDELWASEETKAKNKSKSKAKKKAKKKQRDKDKKKLKAESGSSTTTGLVANASTAVAASTVDEDNEHQYVDFLMQSGSILELAKMMDLEEKDG